MSSERVKNIHKGDLMSSEEQKDKKALEKHEENRIAKVKQFLFNNYRGVHEPDLLYKAIEKKLMPKAGEKERSEIDEEGLRFLVQASALDNLNNSFLLVESVDDEYRAFISDFTKQIISEFSCERPSEKALAQVVVSTYIRVLNLSKKMRVVLSFDHADKERTAYIAILSKELDRAHRQYLTAYQALKHTKMPPLELKLKAKTAFVAQNQQMIDNRGRTDEYDKV